MDWVILLYHLIMNKIIIYTDGGSRGNPGPAGIGVVIGDPSTSLGAGKEYAEYIGEATNNEAEYQAIIFALKKAKHLIGGQKAKKAEIEIRADSELAVKQLEGKYKILDEKIQPLFIKIWNLRLDFGNIAFKLIPREQNKKADRLVNQALDRRENLSSLPGF